ncbi:flavin reductase family protein [Aspergillus undulatus]|uniref:flavin reductase family protein n=1 Tax=Aspergillus undulatus TaxID=1810928 RepID=UPI003CCCC30C
MTQNHVEADDREAAIKRNPHADFGTVERSRPPFQHEGMNLTKTPNPKWQPGDGASNDNWKKHEFTTIDPDEEGRGQWLNYKLLISATVPRPIALASTVSADGKTANIAPFSFWQCAAVDPPMYSISFTSRTANDTLTNLLATKEMCISMTSDWLIEAANFASVNSPRNVSEWPMTGLTQKPSDLVKPAHVAESPYSVECKLHSVQDFYSKRDPSVRTSTLVVVEVIRFHIWSDAIADDRATADVTKLHPVFRAGGIMYGTCPTAFEIPRPGAFRELREDENIQSLI